MDRAKGVKEMSFRRPHHGVELVERAFDNEGTSVVCVAKDESKLFIVFQLFQVARWGAKKAGKMVFLVDDERARIVKSFLKVTSNLGLLSVKTYFDEKDFTKEGQHLLPNCDVMVTKGILFLKILQAGLMDLMSFNLIVFDNCHLARDVDHPFAILLKHIEECTLDLKPKIVGVTSEIQHHLTSPQDVERFICTLEVLFHCKVTISDDILALNRYGEQVEEEIVHYTCNSGKDQFTCRLMEILQKALAFLKDIPQNNVSQECAMFVKHIFTECFKVLLMFGPLQTAYVAGIALKDIKKLEKKCSETYDLLTLQFCRTQMSFILKLSEQGKFESHKGHASNVMTKLLFHMSTHLKPGDDKESSDQGTKSHEDQDLEVNSSGTKHLKHDAENLQLQLPTLQLAAMATSQQSQTKHTGRSQSLNLQSTYGVKTQCDDPLCIVLVPSTIIAKALNSLILKLSDNLPEYSFLKSAFVPGNKAKQGTPEQSCSDETGDNVMECVQDGSVNILIATFEVEQELYVRRCSLLIRLGMPKHYEHYLNVKKRVKSAGAKVVFLVRDEEKSKTDERYKAFHGMENVLIGSCSNSCRPPYHEVKKLFQEDQLEVYEPYGEEGAKVDLLSSISLVNRYCAKFPSGGVGAAIPVCRTEELWTDSHVEFVSTLYLPRNSPIYWPVKASATLCRDEVNKDTVRKARVKSEMLVAMEACRQLHKAEELSEDLQPMFRFKMFSLTAENEKCDCEVADSGAGMDGSVKRNRGYMRKFPSILADNFPVCGEPSFLYSISLELTKPWTFEKAVRSQSKAQSSGACHCIGLLSRKPLPKLPGMLIFDRAGEVTATVTECSSNPFYPSSDQLSLFQRFTEYIFKDIAKPGNASNEAFPKFDPSIATAGYYVVVLKNSWERSSCSLKGPDRKEIAFDFMQSIENAVGSFNKPTDPSPASIQDMEVFTDAVVTALYNEKCLRFYVADICYDRSPADPFPNSEAAATFAEYYQKRYDVEVTLNQPMLDVDHVSSRLNFLLPRYQNIKGQHLAVPGKDSKRSQKSKVFVVPELCSIHPIPGYLWRQLFILPAVLYRMESLLVAEELRSSVARALGRGAVDWPNDVPLPLLTIGEMVGEEVMCETDSLSEDSKVDASSTMGRERPMIWKPKHLAAEEVVLPAVFEGEHLGDKPLGNDIDKPVTFRSNEREDVAKKDFEAVKSTDKPDLDTEDSNTLLHTQLCGASMQISKQDILDLVAVAENRPSRTKSYSNEHSFSNCCDLLSKDDASALPASSECDSSEATLEFSESEGPCGTLEHGSSFEVDHSKPMGEINSDKALITIWTNPLLSRLYETCGPPSTLILRALTTCSAGDLFSLERLEILGDSFVKYAVSSSVFFQHSHQNEGKLSFIRGLRVSNRQLFYLARQRGLPSYMFTGMFNPLVNWLPPGFYYENGNDAKRATDSQLLLMPDKSSQELEEDDEDGGIFIQEELSDQSHKCDGSSSEADSSRILLNPYLHLCCPDKAVADITEALVGVYLLCFGPEGAFRFLEWLGMELTKHHETKDGESENAVIAEDSALADPIAGSEDMSKRPCSVRETSDESLSQLKDTSDLLFADMRGLQSFSSSDATITNLEEAMNCCCRDMSETTCQKFNETLPGKVPDLPLTKSGLLSTPASATTQVTSSTPSYVQTTYNSLSKPQKGTHILRPDSSLLPTKSTNTSSASEFDAVEEALNYRFKNRSLLQQAFTHTSLPRDYNSVRCSYEQLEFLGDALLDFLVTRQLYMHHRHMSPGDLTDLRSAVVNNYSFAALAVKLGFAKHLRSLSPPLFSIVNKFVEKLNEKEMKQQRADNNEIHSSVFVLGSKDSEDFVEVEVPKVLGDLFEAVAGALYVDCGQDLNMVWQVYLPILKPSIDYYSANPPISAIRKLLEMMPNAAKFAPVERMVDGKFRSTLTVSGCGTFVGIGRNFRIAKSTAAQRALTALQKR